MNEWNGFQLRLLYRTPKQVNSIVIAPSRELHNEFTMKLVPHSLGLDVLFYSGLRQNRTDNQHNRIYLFICVRILRFMHLLMMITLSYRVPPRTASQYYLPPELQPTPCSI